MAKDEKPDTDETRDEQARAESEPPPDKAEGKTADKKDEAPQHAVAHASAHGAGEAALVAEAHHGLGHVVPLKLLFAVWGALMCLTILTTEAARVDFGGQGNLIVAMIIATTKASLVIVFFMHLRWDRRFHAMVFLSGLLFVILFIGLALTDRSEYQPFIRAYEQSQNLPAGSMPRLGAQP
jgi:cytochrome c oxidase subunit IV